MNRIILYVVAGVIILGLGFFALNSYIYGEKQGEPSPHTLTSKKWTWVSALYNDGREISPKETDAFTITFTEDGNFTATTDCNQMGGSYLVVGDQITMRDIFMTKMYCEGSQEATFAQLLTDSSNYHLTQEGGLILGLKFDSGSVVFR
ncbi:MAG TPA: META domain-containing protein [Candidatus Paceibacterota bacterium]|nr:META domain-containing protein [Candidatus Paceibacterota bacterium]